MAKRRLNKKVALIGSAMLAVVVVVAIWVVLSKSRNPQKFMEIGKQAVDSNDYETARRSYQTAYKRAKTEELREEILLTLVDVSIEFDRWEEIIKYWSNIITENPGNPDARYGRLKYMYIVAEGGSRRLWQQVHKEAAEFLEVAEQSGLLDEDVAKWDVFVGEGEEAPKYKLGAYLHLVKGKALLEMTIAGAVTDKNASLAEAIADLEAVKTLEPGNIDVYRYLAGAVVERGRLAAVVGNPVERDKAAEESMAYLLEAVKVAEENPLAHVNLLMLKLVLARRDNQARDATMALEDEYLSLVEKFPSSSEAFVALSKYYSELTSYMLGDERRAYLGKAIDAAEEAVKLDKESVAVARNALNLHHRMFSLHSETSHLYRSIELGKNGLTLRDAKDRSGPWNFANKMNRFRLHSFLAHAYIQQILEPCEVRTEAETQQWIADAEDAVYQIEQIFGSGEEPQVIKWRGLLELAKGHRGPAIQKLYAAYDKMKTLKPPRPPWGRDSQFAYLSYLLSRVFKDTSEVGAVAEFLTSALYSGIEGIVPEARLDYVETVLKFNLWSDAMENIDVFEKRLAPNDRSRILRIKTHIGAGEFDEATKALEGRDEKDPNTMKLSLSLVEAKIRQIQLNIARLENRKLLGGALAGVSDEKMAETGTEIGAMKKELAGYVELEEKLIRMLLPIDASFVGAGSVIATGAHHVHQGRVDKAKAIVNEFLVHFPEDMQALAYKEMLLEPDPKDISQARRGAIEEKVLSGIADPVERALQLGIFYRRKGEPAKAIEELNKAFAAEPSEKEPAATWVYHEDEEKTPRILIVSHLFDMALYTKDWALAEKVGAAARQENLDRCQGQVFAARLAFAKQDFQQARVRINEALEQRPVFSRAYSLRSNINAAIGEDHAALEDVRQATSLNPLDGLISKGYAQLLHVRNKNAGEAVTKDEIDEEKTALQRAIALNPRDIELRSFYADFIIPTEPMKALAILQALQRSNPSFENSARLGELATNVARDENDPRRKEALFAIAGSALEDANEAEPQSEYLLHLTAEYYRAMGRDDKAEEVLAKAGADRLLWNHYYQRSQYPEARGILEKLYKVDPTNAGVVKGLLLVAEKTNDANDVQKYSEELIKVEPKVESHLIQIQSFLRVGLIREAELKLASFTEKYPDEARTLLLRAWLVMRKGQMENAVGLTNRFLENNPDSAAGWRLRGEIYFHSGDMNKAINDFKTSKSKNNEIVTRIVLAKAYLRISRFEDAITELKSVVQVPGSPTSARTLLEQTYERLGREDALRNLYDETIKTFPTSVLWLNHAGAFAIDTGDFAKAGRLYGKAYGIRHQLHSDPQGQNLRYDALYATAFDGYLRALILETGVPNTRTWNPKKLDEVAELAGAHIETDYAPLAYLRMAQAKLLLGHKKTAIEYCQIAVDKSESNETLASEVLLRMFLMLGPAEVEKYCLKKIKENPNSLPAHYTLFNLYKISGQYNEALKCIEKCIQLTAGDDARTVGFAAKKAEVLTLAYQRSSDNKYLEMAIGDYESLLLKMPNNTSVLNNLAYMLAENNERPVEALKYAERVYNMLPNDPGILDTYGYALFRNGKYAEAAEYVTSAIQQYQQKKISMPPEVYEHLGMAKEALKDKQGALDAYKQALVEGASRLSEKSKGRLKKTIERVSR